jgi:hypothetical protein
MIHFYSTMEIPDDVLQIIKEYSKPVTRPDWRKLHRMCEMNFHTDIAYTYNISNIPCINSFVTTYEKAPNKYKYLRYNYSTIKKPIALVYIHQ